MKKVAIAMVLLAAVPVIGACGIDPGPVVTYGKAPQDQRLNQLSTKDLVRPENLRDEVDLVKRFLRAAADKTQTQLQTVRSYLEDKSWKPAAADELNIYRVLEEPVNEGKRDNTIPVSVLMQRIGVLKAGRLEPVYEERTSMQFTVVDSGYTTGYLLSDPPPGLILTDEMLRSRYLARPVYFWNNEDKRLVPDLRYIPTTDMLEPEKAKLLIDYLYAGPSPFLVKAVKPAPGQVPLRSIPVHNNDGSLTIDLPDQLPEDDLARLSIQLQRTLVGGAVSGIRLKIQGVPVQPSDQHEVRDVGTAARFAVQAQKVVRIDGGPDRPVPLKPEINNGVEWAVFSRREQSVAMSRIVNGVKQFFVGPVSSPQAVPSLKPAEQAAWLDGESQTALVLSDQKLYAVEPGVETAKVTPLAGPVPGPVTSFSVVPDGRIALVVDKKFYMAALYSVGEVLTITQPQQVPTALDQVQHVALSRIDAIIAGVGLDEKQTKLVVTQINIDGVNQQTAWADYGVGEQISRLVTGVRNTATVATYYDYKGVAYQVGEGGASPVGESQLAPQPGASAAPSGSPAATPPPAITAVSFEG